MRTVWLALAVGCDGRPLSDLGATVVSIQAGDTQAGQPPYLRADFDTPGCAGFCGAEATFAGRTVDIVDPERDSSGNCVQGYAWFDQLPAGTFTDQPMTFVVADSSAKWSVELTGLANRALAPTGPFAFGGTTTFLRTDGPPIVNGCFRLTGDDQWPYAHGCVHDDGIRLPTQPPNAIALDLPPYGTRASNMSLTAVGEVTLSGAPAHGTSEGRCIGPARCEIELTVTFDQPITIGN